MESDETVGGPYLDLLDHALEDRRVTSEEAKALDATAIAWGLTREHVFQAHYGYVDALVATALADGIVTEAERRDLLDVARLLGIPTGTLDAIITQVDSARRW
jgi:DNA polymerase-3 subunit epsilon